MLRFLLLRCCYLGLLLGSSVSALAAIDVHEFANDVERERYQSFIDEMRCPKCQNQNLSGSDSPIATDLRNQLYSMIKDGRSDKEIVDFMVERYGEFILYRPRLSPSTILLWALPGLLLLLGGVVLALIVRKRRMANTEVSTSLSALEQEKLKSLLENKFAPDEKTNPVQDNKLQQQKSAAKKGSQK